MFKFCTLFSKLTFLLSNAWVWILYQNLTITAAIPSQDLKLYLLKGLYHKMDLALDDMFGLKKFRCANDFIIQQVYFSWLMRVYVGLIMLAVLRDEKGSEVV
jgi:hypothetical protein